MLAETMDRKGVVHMDFIFALGLFLAALVIYINLSIRTLAPTPTEVEKAELEAIAEAITELLSETPGNPPNWESSVPSLDSNTFRLGLGAYDPSEYAHYQGKSPTTLSLAKLVHLNLTASNIIHGSPWQYLPYSEAEFYTLVPAEALDDPDADWRKYIIDGRIVNAKSSLDLTAYDFLIKVEPIDPTTITFKGLPIVYGGQLPTDRLIACIHRIMLLRVDIYDGEAQIDLGIEQHMVNKLIPVKVTVYVWGRR